MPRSEETAWSKIRSSRKNKLKITFVNLPSPGESQPALDINLAIGYLSAYLKKFGFNDISLVDYTLLHYPYLDFEDKTYLSRIPKSDVYCLTGNTVQFHWMKEIGMCIKEKYPSCINIVGGHHASCRPQEVLDATSANYVVEGEGEIALVNILSNLEQEGIVTGEKIKNLDNLPFPDRTLTDFGKYKRTLLGTKACHMVTLRGCPFNCYFCDKKSVGRDVRFRSAENVILEVDSLISKYNIKAFVIYDDIFTLKKERAIKIAEELGKRNVKWRAWTRVDTIDPEMLVIMKANGLTSITVGVESGSDEMLKIYNKGTTREQNIEFLSLCREVGVPVRCSLIYGGPYETVETLKETISLVQKTQPDEWNVSTFIPMPGSRIGDNPEDFDIEVLPDPEYLSYYRIGMKSGLGGITVKISTMTEEEYVKNRAWFIKQLENVSKRKVIQDTIQDINL